MSSGHAAVGQKDGSIDAAEEGDDEDFHLERGEERVSECVYLCESVFAQYGDMICRQLCIFSLRRAATSMQDCEPSQVVCVCVCARAQA